MVYWGPQDSWSLDRLCIRGLSMLAPVPVSYSGFFSLSQEKMLNIFNQLWLSLHFSQSHQSSSKLHADRSLRSCVTPERVRSCCVDRGICLGKAGTVLSQDEGLTGHLKDQLGRVPFSLEGNALSCICRLISKFAEGAQFPKTLLVAVLSITQYFSENPWNFFR